MLMSLSFAQDYVTAYNNGKEAFEAKDYKAYLREMQTANQIRANHQTIMYHLALAHSLNDNSDSACYWLIKVINIDAYNYPLDKEQLKGLKESSCYQQLVKRQEFLQNELLSSTTLLSLADSTLHIEGVTYDANNRRFLVSSINKRNIFAIDQNGNATAILKETLPLSPTGIAIDTDGFLLVTAMGIKEGGLSEDSPQIDRSALFKIDLTKGEVIEKYELSDGEPHLFGDLIINQKGEILISDSKQNIVYLLDGEGLKTYLKHDDFISLQGLVQIDQYLFIVDYVNGIYAYNPESKQLQKLENKLDINLKGIDGLYADEGRLIAIQNGTKPFKVISLTLDERNETITSFKVLDRFHSEKAEPTLGILRNHVLYYVSKSFWPLNKNGVIENPENIKPEIRLLRLEETISTTAYDRIEYVKVLNNHEDEVLFFYENNWLVFRKYAEKHGFIEGYEIKQVADSDYDIILTTTYKDEQQEDSIEVHFKKWMSTQSGANLLNELTPKDFRKSIKVEKQAILISNELKGNRISAGCTDSVHRVFDFWLGDWEVHNPQGNYVGHNYISLVENGCGLKEQWSGAGGGYTGTSYNFYDANTGKWHQSWIDNQGGILQLKGEMENGVMVMKTEPSLNANNQTVINKVSWTPKSENEVVQLWQVSTDNGENWQTVFHGIYRK